MSVKRDGSEYNYIPPKYEISLVVNPASTNKVGKLKEIKRDSKGRFLKGYTGNIHGVHKDSGVNKLIKQMFGPNLEELILLAAEVIAYDTTTSKHKWPKWKNADKLRMLEYLMNRVEGTPTQQIKAEVETKQINVNIDVPDDFNIMDIN